MSKSSIKNEPVMIFDKSIRWYVDIAELPAVALTVVIVLTYVISFWFQVTYLRVVLPLVFLEQLVGGAVVGYLIGIRHKASLTQMLVVAGVVAGVGGVVSGIMAVARFRYLWLLLNIITEPVWSIILGIIVAGLIYSFFKLGLRRLPGLT